jgi:transcriptional regulator with GAF, ATPase, and Fis domain
MTEEQLKTLTAVQVKALRRRRFRLQVIDGPDKGRELEFDERARIGARSVADLVLQDPLVSGLHCEVLGGEQARVRDLGSKNGTFLGRYRVWEAQVPSGETLSVGNTRIRVQAVEGTVDVPLLAEDHFHGIVGRSSGMRALTAQLARLAASDTTVLIQGETGTGKERVAEALHVAGTRVHKPLVIVDCGSLPPNLIEAELFGHERGAFTGAIDRKPGAFERANHGTLFLDEIGELPLDLQPKLLRALESRKVRRVGGSELLPVDVRVMAATHRDLALEVGRGRFREDLYYRLAVVTVSVPPLRERLDDVPLLAVHLLKEMGVDPASHLTAESVQALMAHDWPGNVRELRNTLERAVALLQPVALSGTAVSEREPDRKLDLQEPLKTGKARVTESYERAYVTALLAECRGNVSEVARRAGMDRMSIHRIIQRLKLRGADEKDG